MNQETIDKSGKKALGNFKTQRAQKNVIIRGSSKKGERYHSRNSKNLKSAYKKQRFEYDSSDKGELRTSISATKLAPCIMTSTSQAGSQLLIKEQISSNQSCKGFLLRKQPNCSSNSKLTNIQTETAYDRN